MNKQFIFIDIDGTLFNHHTFMVSEASKKALTKAHKNGHVLFLCTGRPLPDIDSCFLELPIEGMILSSGTNIYAHGSCIYHAHFPQDELKMLVEKMIELEIGFVLEGRERSYLYRDAYEAFTAFMGNEGCENSELVRIALNENNKFHFEQMKEADYEQVLKISIFSTKRENTYHLMEQLPKDLCGFLHENETFDILNGEITVKDINKASGIDKILAHYCHPLSQTIAIGDSLNDLEMIEHAAVGISMGNAPQILKEKADFITKSIDDEGLFYAFKHFHLID